MVLSIRDKDSVMNTTINDMKSIGDENHKHSLQDTMMLPNELKQKELMRRLSIMPKPPSEIS
jgi:hypothetical protein